MQPLISLLREGSPTAKAHTAGALAHLASNSRCQNAIREEGGIPLLINVLREGSQDAQERAEEAIKNLASSNRNQGVIREERGIQALMDAQIKGSKKAQESAAAALQNLQHPGMLIVEPHKRPNLVVLMIMTGVIAVMTSCNVGRSVPHEMMQPLLAA